MQAVMQAVPLRLNLKEEKLIRICWCRDTS